MIKIHCDGCDRQIERVDGLLAVAIKGEMSLLMYRGDISNLRDPRMAQRRHSASNFHWCDKCAGTAVAAVKEANETTRN